MAAKVASTSGSLATFTADEQGAAAVTAAHFRLGHLQIGAVDVDERKRAPVPPDSGRWRGPAPARPVMAMTFRVISINAPGEMAGDCRVKDYRVNG